MEFGYRLTRETAFAPQDFQVSAAATVVPALTSALDADSWESMVRTTIALGGDTDTLACIAGAVAEAAFGIPQLEAVRARSYLTADFAEVLSRFEGCRGD